jgi:ATP-dependent RNA helicase RhlE
MTDFSELKLIEPIQRAISDTGYTKPTPIQSQAIPLLLEGRDLLGVAQTGTGKTAAFALPILNGLASRDVRIEPRSARVLILTPTRELAIQIHESFQVYGKHLRLKYAVVFGGVGQGPQVTALSRGVDVLVATPGRLLDLIDQKYINLRSLEVFVLDEADRMLDMGFIHDIKKVVKMLPAKRQTLFFSATMPPDIQALAGTMLTDPAKVSVTPVSSTAERIAQWVMYVDKDKKKDALRYLLGKKEFSRVIVFTRTKHGANKVAELLSKNKISSEAIHGNKSQNARQRALENFKAGRTRVLIATDIAARGIDIDEISHVINYEVPNVAESYVHRIGRTARAGSEGIAISLCDAEERSFIRDIEKLIGKPIPVVKDQPYHSEQVANSRIVSAGKAKAMIEGRSGRSGRPGGGGGGGGRNNNRRPQAKSQGGGASRPQSSSQSSSGARPQGSAQGNKSTQHASRPSAATKGRPS